MEQKPDGPAHAAAVDPNGQHAERPARIKKAVALLWLMLGLGLISYALQWHYVTTLRGIAFAIYVAFAIFVVVAWLIHKISRGRNWARITFLLLLIAVYVLALLQLRSGIGRFDVAAFIGILQLLTQSWALYLMFSEPGRRWFRKRS